MRSNMQNRLVGWIGIGVAGLTLAGCVTINIYFPAAEAQKAADKIIDQVWQLKPPATPPAPTTKGEAK